MIDYLKKEYYNSNSVSKSEVNLEKERDQILNVSSPTNIKMLIDCMQCCSVVVEDMLSLLECHFKRGLYRPILW